MVRLAGCGAAAVAMASVTVLVAGTADVQRQGPGGPGAGQAASQAAGPVSPGAQAATLPVDLGAPAPGARSPRNANYSIDARLDPARRTLGGREIITWRNITPGATSEVRLHLYWNAWKNTRSTWLREAALGSRRGPRDDRPERDWGWTAVTAVRLLGAAPPVNLTARGRHVAPDDGNPDDQTVLAVPLPTPVAPGETVNLEVEWNARVPRTFARTGSVGRFFFLAQWFPKVGVLEPQGWNAHQFHAGTEFFSDYGVYDVRLRVPTGWVVGATGTERSRQDNGDGTTTHRYVQEDVHDFAWTTSPDLVEHRQRFTHRGLPAVEMRLLLQPEHAEQAGRHFAATVAALRFYGEWFGPYPYGHVTIVDPAWQSGAGGMEYPTLFTAGTRWLAPAGVTRPEGVTVHEAGHQFWYGIVGNNEFEHAWLDEGFNTFATARAQEAAGFPNFLEERYFGGFVPWVFDIPLSRHMEDGWDGYRLAAESDAQATPSWRYFPATGGSITYSKTALWLHTLERHLGWPTVQRILSTHFARWQFRHPRPEDFFAVANEVSGQDLTWFFDEVYRGSNAFDYAVADLTSRPKRVRGYVDEGGRPAFVDREIGRGVFETTVVVRREGEAVFPVDVAVRFADGAVERVRWDGRARWKALRFERPARAVSAELDPDGVLLLDVNLTNNSRTLEPAAGRAATRWAVQWVAWVQDLLMTYAFFV